MDALLVVNRLPRLAERAMRGALVAALERGRLTPRALVNDALIGFERVVQAAASEGIRPALLFAERDRIVRELRAFIESKLAARVGHVARRDLVALAAAAKPFDAIVRDRRGRCWALVVRRLPVDCRRLEVLRRVSNAVTAYARTPLAGALVYDFTSGRWRLVAPSVSNEAGSQRVNRDLRAS
jgi:hypothetical protein